MDSTGYIEFHSEFIKSTRPHVLMITNHGIHQWDVIPGLRDTGGQNVFVNQFSDAMVGFGFKVTIINRGGYRHPVTGGWQRGLLYKNEFMRLYYLEDELNEFVRKEDMFERIPYLVEALKRWMITESVKVDLIVSHYWDGALLGVLYNESLQYRIKHIWVPHSLGMVKKKNVDSSEWEKLRIEERIAVEKELVGKLDGIASTSTLIQKSLVKDYGYRGPEIFLPPCIDTKRYHPHTVGKDSRVWRFLEEKTGKTVKELSRMGIVTEISRTDTTKGKEVLIKAFAEVIKRISHSLLVVAIDERRRELSEKLRELIREFGIEGNVVPVGSIWDLLPDLYAISDVYCTPAIQEGFGMSAQEAAATGVPVIASERVPFVTEYLLGESREEVKIGVDASDRIVIGEGGIIVGVNDVRGFAFAMELLLKDEDLRLKMGRRAYEITIPYFTWDNMVERFLKAIEF